MPESESRSSAAPWHVPVAVEEVAEAYAWRDMDPLSIRAPVSEDVRHATK